MSMSPRLLRPRSGYIAPDADARAYISSVETADGQKLETGVARAINDFVAGCKSDGTWTAIKASCILMGARTLSGALKPLAGTAPANNNFVSADYNRKTGLKGDGVGKYLDSGRNANVDPQDSHHIAVYAAAAPTGSMAYAGAGAGATGTTQFGTNGTAIDWRNRSATADSQASVASSTGLIGMARDASASYTVRVGGSTTTYSRVSETPHNGNVLVFARNSATNVAGIFSDARISLYSIGSSLDLALLDSRVSALYTAIGAAI